MFYDGYHIWGMHLIWWCIWGILLVWIFATPWSVPGQKWVAYSPLNILQQRFAAGKITKLEYQERKEILEKDLAKK
jgi:putative membrane protein